MIGVFIMANMFANLAMKATSLSPIIEGKTKISVADIVSQYPDGVTVTEFDIVAGTDQNGESITYPVFTFAEDTSRFGFGGKVMRSIVDAWISAFEGDVEATSKALAANGGVKLRFSLGKTKNGRPITLIEPVVK